MDIERSAMRALSQSRSRLIHIQNKFLPSAREMGFNCKQTILTSKLERELIFPLP